MPSSAVRPAQFVAGPSRSGSTYVIAFTSLTLFTRLHAVVISTEPPSGGRHTNYGRHRSTISPLGQRICVGQVDAGPLDCAPYRRLAAHSEPTAAHVALTFVCTLARQRGRNAHGSGCGWAVVIIRIAADPARKHPISRSPTLRDPRVHQLDGFRPFDDLFAGLIAALSG